MTVNWTEIGAAAGSLLAGLVGGTFVVAGWIQKKKGDTGQHALPRQNYSTREELMSATTELRIKIEDAAKEAREARVAALAAQSGLQTIGNVIERSMQALGDRMERAIDDLKEHSRRLDESLLNHHGRLTAVETQLSRQNHGK